MPNSGGGETPSIENAHQGLATKGSIMKVVAAAVAVGLVSTSVCADISGVVKDSKQNPVSKAFVRFVASADTANEAHTFTDSLGRYSLKLGGLTGMQPRAATAPFKAGQSLRNYPNPFSSHTAIGFSADNAGPVELSIFSSRGRLVREFKASVAKGAASLVWNGADAAGLKVNDGLYVCRLRHDGREERATMMMSRFSLQAGPGASTPRDCNTILSKKEATNFNVLVYGKRIFPLKQTNVAITDGITENFTLPYVTLWDSSRTILRDDFANCQTVFQSTKKGRVVFLGGSITFNPGWRDSVSGYIQARFPQTVFTFVNAGIPSVGSNMHAFRAKRDVFSSGKVDLLFVESAVNDTTNNIRDNINKTARQRATEGIIRQARANNPAIDIVAMYFADDVFYPGVQSGDSIPFMGCYETPAWNYGVSCINLAQYVAERYTWAQFGGDVHPQAFGQGIYARVFKSFLNGIWNDSLASGSQTVAHFTPARPARFPLLPIRSLRQHFHGKSAFRLDLYRIMAARRRHWHPRRIRERSRNCGDRCRGDILAQLYGYGNRRCIAGRSGCGNS